MLYDKLLVLLDGSPASWKALREAVLLARDLGAEVTTLSAIDTLPRYAATVSEVDAEKEERSAYFAGIQAEALKLASDHGVTLHSTTVVGRPYPSLAEHALSGGFRLVIVGRDGRGTSPERQPDLSCSDLLVVAAAESEEVRSSHPGQVRDIGGLPVAESMSRDVTALRPETSLREAVDLLATRNLRVAPVVDGAARVIGIVTNGDLVERGGLRLRIELLRALTPAGLSAELAAAEEGRTVADVMTREVVTVPPHATVADAAHLMLQRQLKRLPVVDSEGRLLGMISRVDLLRASSSGHVADAAEVPPTSGQTIGEVLRRDVPTVRRGASLAEVLDAVVSTRLNRALVVDGTNRVLGLVTDAELVKRLSPRDHPGIVRVLMSKLPFASLSAQERREIELATAVTAEELMVTNVPTVRASTPVPEAVGAMLRERRKILPVVDEVGRLLGAVDRADLLRIVAAPRASQDAK